MDSYCSRELYCTSIAYVHLWPYGLYKTSNKEVFNALSDRTCSGEIDAIVKMMMQW